MGVVGYPGEMTSHAWYLVPEFNAGAVARIRKCAQLSGRGRIEVRGAAFGGGIWFCHVRKRPTFSQGRSLGGEARAWYVCFRINLAKSAGESRCFVFVVVVVVGVVVVAVSLTVAFMKGVSSLKAAISVSCVISHGEALCVFQEANKIEWKDFVGELGGKVKPGRPQAKMMVHIVWPDMTHYSVRSREGRSGGGNG